MATRELEIASSNSTIDWASEQLELKYAEIGRMLGVDRRTVYRWRVWEHAPARRNLEQIEKLRELRYLLESVFEDFEGALAWLHAPVPMLRGRTPRSLMLGGQLDPVIGVLAGLQTGAHS